MQEKDYDPDTDVEKFWVGLYVPPGEEEADFTWYAAFWGMPTDSDC